MKRWDELDERSRQWVERVVSAAPQLTDAQARQLERLLCAADDDGGGGAA